MTTLNRLVGVTVAGLSITTVLIAAYPGLVRWSLVPAWTQWTLLGALSLTATAGVILALTERS